MTCLLRWMMGYSLPVSVCVVIYIVVLDLLHSSDTEGIHVGDRV